MGKLLENLLEEHTSIFAPPKQHVLVIVNAWNIGIRDTIQSAESQVL